MDSVIFLIISPHWRASLTTFECSWAKHQSMLWMCEIIFKKMLTVPIWTSLDCTWEFTNFPHSLSGAWFTLFEGNPDHVLHGVNHKTKEALIDFNKKLYMFWTEHYNLMKHWLNLDPTNANFGIKQTPKDPLVVFGKC